MVPPNLEQCMTRGVQTEAQCQFAEGVNLGRQTGSSSLRSVMVQGIDGDEENRNVNTIHHNDRAARNAYWICGEVGHYANECLHNINNMKNRGGKEKLVWSRKGVNVLIPLRERSLFLKG